MHSFNFAMHASSTTTFPSILKWENIIIWLHSNIFTLHLLRIPEVDVAMIRIEQMYEIGTIWYIWMCADEVHGILVLLLMM